MWNPFKKKAKCSFKELRTYVYLEYHYRIAISEKHDYLRVKTKYHDILVDLYRKHYDQIDPNVQLGFDKNQNDYLVWTELRKIIGKQIPELLV